MASMDILSVHRGVRHTRVDEDFLGQSVVAALLGAALGVATMGVLTTLAAMHAATAAVLVNGGPHPSRGALLLAVAVWLVSWSGLHEVLRHRAGPNHGLIACAGVLLLVGAFGMTVSA